MTPQSNFTIIAPIRRGHIPELTDLLKGMNVMPDTPNACRGMAYPFNDVIPFGKFDKLHYARFVILDDQTLEDFGRIGEPAPDYGPPSLAFMGDCDGSADKLLTDMAQHPGNRLHKVFSHCEGFDPTTTNLLDWMKQHSVPAAAAYVNHIGRTVIQIYKDKDLRRELMDFLKTNPPPDNQSPQVTRQNLVNYARAKGLIPKSYEPVPIACKIRKFLDAMPVPVGFVLAAALVGAFLLALLAATFVVIRIVIGMMPPFPVAFLALGLLIGVIVFLVALRSYETAESEIAVRPTDAYTEKLARDEDHDVVNQYSVMGSAKPTAFRGAMLIVNLWVVKLVARQWYGRGYLARIRTIHFARWVFIDDKRRVLFASSYDGSLESYNDDFINKSGFGLNFAFASGLGYPRCRWMLFDGATREQKFKYALRRHQLTTQVWYNAYPGLTVYELARNARVREGLDRPTMSNVEIRRWLADL